MSADVAVLKNPRFVHVPQGMTYQCFDVRDIADDYWVIDPVNVMDALRHRIPRRERRSVV